MSDNRKNIPIRRFKEFQNADAWEQRKVEEICTNMSAGGDVDKSKLVEDGKYPVIANALTNDGIVGYYNDDFRIKAPAVTVTGRGDVGHAKARKTDFTPIVRLLTLETNHDVDFLENAINTLSIVNESTGVPQLTVPQLSKYIVSIPPTLEEEKKIGEYLLSMDNLITLHQRKLEKIKALKSAYLSEMFPAEGERKPKRRFAGFTDHWEQRKFKHVFDYLQNNSLSRADLSEESGGVLNIHYGDILVKFGEVIDVENESLPSIVDESILSKYQSSILKDGDIVIADAAEDETVGKCSEIKGLDNKKVLAGLHTIPVRPKEKYATGYLGYYLNSNSYHDQLIPLMQGTKVSSISKAAIQETEILFPTDEAEQQQIGDYLQKLDYLITLHQRKLDKLQNIKKAYLNEMFV